MLARKGTWLANHLTHVLSIKPAEVVQEACLVLEKYGCPVMKKLKSELSSVADLGFSQGFFKQM